MTKLFSLNNDNLDSPASIATLMMSMKNIGINKFEVLQNTNSGKLFNDELIETTSYYLIEYYRQ